MATVGTSVSRRLLGRLRDVMAGAGSAEERLNRTVGLIADGLKADVCSCYVLRAGEVLELFATKGLLASAVHATRLRVGEGLVGLIAAQAKPLAFADAQNHPAFVYRPETGEDIYHSLMGVPILRGGRMMGVLVVQNKTQRNYSEEEIEILETVAMVLAELVAGGLVPRDEQLSYDGNALLPLRFEGIRLNAGIAIGHAVVHRSHVSVQRLVAEDSEAELARFKEALAGLHNQLDALLNSADMAQGGEHRDVLETYRMFAQDAGWIGRIVEAIQGGLTAEAAVQKVHDDTRARMSQVSDPYLRERLLDFEDLANRLIQHLAGKASGPLDLPDDTILFARTLGPAELLDYDRKKLKGLVLEEGSPTMHVAIIARALDIPVIGRVPEILSRVEPMDPVVVDGDTNQVFLRPGEDILSAFRANLALRVQRLAAYAAERDLPAVTKDGEAVGLFVNAGLLADLQYLESSGAQGVGLYRTEIPFMARPELPDVEAQTQIYGKIFELAAGRPVVFRTLDVGGDKVLPYWNGASEENPAMGWRSIRITLDRPAVLRQQLRALIRAAEGRELSVMFPMVAEVFELDKAREILGMEIAREASLGHPKPKRVRVGTMLEVPALAFQIEALLKRVDFISVGSNDLVQFLFASDRGNPRLSDRYDTLAPAVLTFLKRLVDACKDRNVSLSLCGEMGGQPVDAMALIGIGFRNLSMHVPSIGPVRRMIRSLELGPLEAFMSGLLDRPDRSLRLRLKAYARDHGVDIG
ncbi:MAG: phosphoenolpyruvate--protein phosphotransferase [Alphaproteobacteria bacterium]|nr:phosphoenolpyruvate--protein phosphotransferase [Alphaproteobacteria bacterium]